MLSEQNTRTDDAIKKLANDIDKQRLRKMQADMHKCAARCCESSVDSMEKVHHCVESCTINLQRAQQYIRSEMENSQNRLQRCLLNCHDEMRDKMGVNPTEAESRMCSKGFEECATKCVDKFIDLMPNMLKHMNEELSKESYKVGSGLFNV